MLRRGFNYNDFLEMPFNEFYELWFFETYIEPQGPMIQDSFQAHLAYSAFVNNPNLKPDASKKIKLDDFRLIPKQVFLSDKEKEDKRKKDEEANKSKIESLFDPDILARARAKADANTAKKVKNGKE
ncbi:hypothetical protein AB2B46_15385 [Kluyvera intermedia]|uniref:hypothetical protein n=1 Tax=Kluyvera intermedia TaxID=61648 RepID=UPI0034A22ED8